MKMNDLEDQAEPPISGVMGASSSTNFRGEAMDVEESIGMQEEVHLVEQLNPGGGHVGSKALVG